MVQGRDKKMLYDPSDNGINQFDLIKPDLRSGASQRSAVLGFAAIRAAIFLPMSIGWPISVTASSHTSTRCCVPQ